MTGSRIIRWASADRSQADFITRCSDRIDHLLSLQRGWDSYRAPAISARAGAFALLVVMNVREIVGVRANALAKFGIFPTLDGGIMMEWHLGPRSLYLEVRADGTLVASKDDDGDEWGLTPSDLGPPVNWLLGRNDRPVREAEK